MNDFFIKEIVVDDKTYELDDYALSYLDFLSSLDNIASQEYLICVGTKNGACIINLLNISQMEIRFFGDN